MELIAGVAMVVMVFGGLAFGERIVEVVAGVSEESHAPTAEDLES